MKKVMALSAFAAIQALAQQPHVFILSGQSNMVGSGDMKELRAQVNLHKFEVPKNVKVFRDIDGCPDESYNCLPDDHRWRNLRDTIDPIFGPEMGIAQELRKKIPENEPIYLIKVPFGGTFLQATPNQTGWEWDPLDPSVKWQSWGTTSPLVIGVDRVVKGSITGDDPQVVIANFGLGNGYDLSIGGMKNAYVKVKYRNSSPSRVGKIYFRLPGGDFCEANSKEFQVVSNDVISREYIVDMSTVPSWNGTLDGLRFDPSTASTGSFSIDYIRRADAWTNRSWEFSQADFSEGWVGNGTYPVQWHDWLKSLVNTSSNGWITSFFYGDDPWVLSPDNLNVYLGKSKTIRIGMLNASPATEADIYFQTTSDAGFSEENRVTFPIIPNDNNMVREYVVDMSKHQKWQGTLRRLRVDPSRSNVNGGASIDYIRITTPENRYWLRMTHGLYPWFLRNVRKALADLTKPVAMGGEGLSNYSLDGFFWMQGESDATHPNTADTYDKGLASFVRQVRTDVGVSNLPFIYGKIRSEQLSLDQYLGMKRMEEQNIDKTDAELQSGYYSGYEVWSYAKQVKNGQYLAQSSIPYSRCVEETSTRPTKVAGCVSRPGVKTDPAVCDPFHYGTNSSLLVGIDLGKGFVTYFDTPTSIGGCVAP